MYVEAHQCPKITSVVVQLPSNNHLKLLLLLLNADSWMQAETF